eukprot:COSAG04_NODE_692_length_11095_cov_3.236541_10_plen_257_part_00
MQPQERGSGQRLRAPGLRRQHHVYIHDMFCTGPRRRICLITTSALHASPHFGSPTQPTGRVRCHAATSTFPSCAVATGLPIEAREGEKGTAFPKRAAGAHRSHTAGERAVAQSSLLLRERPGLQMSGDGVRAFANPLGEGDQDGGEEHGEGAPRQKLTKTRSSRRVESSSRRIVEKEDTRRSGTSWRVLLVSRRRRCRFCSRCARARQATASAWRAAGSAPQSRRRCGRWLDRGRTAACARTTRRSTTFSPASSGS